MHVTASVRQVERVDCDRGYYQRDRLDKDGTVCSKCPRNKICKGGAWLPMPKKGYFSPMKDVTDEATQCFSAQNCPGGDTLRTRGCYQSMAQLDGCFNNKSVVVRRNPITDNYGSSFVW